MCLCIKSPGSSSMPRFEPAVCVMATIESWLPFNLKRSTHVFIEGMKRSRNEDSATLHFAGQKANKLPRSEIEKLISEKVVTAVEQSDSKMKNLMERIGEVNGEPRYDAKIKKLEAHVRKIKRRGDAVFAYIRKFRSLGISQNQSPPSVSPPPVQPQRCISPAEPITNIFRRSVNGGCFSDNASVSSADNDCEMTTLKRPKKGFWQSLRPKNQVVDLTEDRAARLNEESLVTQPSDQKSEPSRQEPSKPSSTPPIAIKEEKESVMEEDRVSSSVQLEEEDWHSKLHPFPDTPFPKELPVVAASYNLPQKPVVKLARIGSAQELGIAWNVDRKDPHVAEMDCYYIYVSHEHKNSTFSGWKCLGEIKAMPLPMACKVSDCKGDKRLCFIVVGKDIFGRYGPYSDIRTVASGQI
ncbi:activating transcription factor 7-interacting protein 2 isoform X3 [Onychostoma macrolepis]|uniref:activating transcription factor 7-interacting protein 2 isoform X3 n=1 Tax=Onychostoma macrolepis TaxID=369639 RepID=UPI00272C921A|nr:activating transcription factor 7-interacting protein 2 isoform X3 [Onychostoma macrolepis]